MTFYQIECLLEDDGGMVGICHGGKLPVGQDDNDDGNDDDDQVTREDGWQ